MSVNFNTMRHPFVTIGAVLILLFLCVGAWYFTTVRDFRVDIAVHDISSQDYTGAINILQKVVNKDDGSKRIAGVYGLLGEAYYYRGLASNNVSDFDGALFSLKRSISINPEQKVAIRNLTQLLASQESEGKFLSRSIYTKETYRKELDKYLAMGLSIDDKDPVFNDLKQVLMEVDRENKKQAAEVISELEKLDSILPRK